MKIRKLTAFLCALTLIAASCTQNYSTDINVFKNNTVSAEEILNSDNYNYEILNDGTVRIVEYYGPGNSEYFEKNETDFEINTINIPSEIDGRKVTVIGESIFDSKLLSSVTQITIPDTVTIIESSAFARTNITEIVIPDSVIIIGERAFEYNNYLEKVTLSKNIKKLSARTFDSCPILKTINGIENIAIFDEYALNQTQFLAELIEKDPLVIINNTLVNAVKSTGDLIIPENVTNITSDAFKGKASWTDAGWIEEKCTITSLHIPAGCTRIGKDAFWRNLPNIESITVDPSNPKYRVENDMLLSDNGTKIEYVLPALKDAVIPESVTNIGTAFEYTYIESVTIPESVKVIPERAFYSCSKLKKVILPEGLKRIEKYSFEKTNVENIDIPDSVEYVHQKAFDQTPLLINQEEPVRYAGNWVIEISDGADAVLKEGTVGIADNYEKIMMETVGSKNCDPSSLTIPDSVKYIYPVFYNYNGSKLENLTISEELLNKYNYNFVNTPWSLKNQKTEILDNGLEIRGNIVTGGFNCKGDIEIPIGITGIVPQAFCLTEGHYIDGEEYSCHNCNTGAEITSVILPDTIKRLENGPFEGCKSLKTIDFPENLEYLGELFFSYHHSPLFNYFDDHSYEVPENLILPETLTGGSFMMQGQNMNCITLPGSLKVLPAGLMNGALQTATQARTDYLVISEGIEKLESFSLNCQKAIYLPKSLKLIENSAFSWLSKAREIYYGGSEDEWNDIDIDHSINGPINNSILSNSIIHFNSSPKDLLDYAGIKSDDYQQSPEDTDFLPGDINDDGSVSAVDIVVLMKYILLIDDNISKNRADLNHNGTVDMFDLMRLKNIILNGRDLDNE